MLFISNAVYAGSGAEPIEVNGIAFHRLSVCAGSGSDSGFPSIL